MTKESVFLPSLLRGFMAKESQVVTWEMVYNSLTDGSLRELTERFRATRDGRWKAQLLSITPACQLNGTGKEAKDVVGMTGIAMADFDHLPAERLEEVRALVNADPHTFLSYVTVSGDGLRVLFRYEGTDYATAFLAGNCHYADLIGHPFDEKCCNPNRLSALCHDSQAYFCEGAKVFRGSKDLKDFKDFKDSKDFNDLRDSNDAAAYAVRIVEKHGESYYPGNRHTYLMKCVAMMNKLGVSQAEAEQWALSHDLGEREIRTLVKSVYGLYAGEHGTYEVPCRREREESCHVDKLTRPSRTHTREGDGIAACETLSGRHRPEPGIQSFPDYRWPRFIQQMVDCADTKPQQDVLLMSVITVLGGTLGRTVRVNYSKRYWYPALQTFVIAPPASGKSVITWARRLVDALNRMLEKEYDTAKKEYDRKKAEYDNAGKERASMECPEPPRLNVYHIAGNNSSSGIIENLDDCGGWGLICESEADTLSAAINADYGNWGDILRKSFDHDLMIMFRRTNKERRKIECPCLSVLISGTPAQVKPLIVSAENGQFSREVFMQLPAIGEFIDQFEEDCVDMDARFVQWGQEWLYVWKALRKTTGCIELRLTQEQRTAFNTHFSELFHHADYTQPTHHMKSSVAREAINLLRVMQVVAFFRAIERIGENGDDLRDVLDGGTLPLAKSDLFRVPADIPEDNIRDGIVTRYEMLITDEDFRAVLALAEPIYRHACDVLALLPSTEAVRNTLSAPDLMLSRLPLQFNYAEAVEMGDGLGITRANVATILKRLVREGKLVKPSRGNYELAFPCNVSSRPRVCEKAV